jgi:hypothetical protein
MATLRAGNLLGWPPPLVLSGSQDPAGCACIPPGEPPSQNQPNLIGWEGVSEIEASRGDAKQPRRRARRRAGAHRKGEEPPDEVNGPRSREYRAPALP